MTQMNTELIPFLQQSLEIDLAENISIENLKVKLAHHINHLIQNDFNKLISVLYRVDINETKLKQLLKENPDEDAATIIADLIIERQLQKINSQQQFRGNSSLPGEEKW